jgi:hypothetical protein
MRTIVSDASCADHVMLPNEPTLSRSSLVIDAHA